MAIDKIRENFEKERKIAEEISNLSEELVNSDNEEEKKVIASQISLLKESLREISNQIINSTEETSLNRPLNQPPSIAQIKKEAETVYVPKTQIQRQVSMIQKQAVTEKKAAEQIKEQAKKLTAKPKKEKTTPLEKLTLKRMGKKSIHVVKKKEKKASTYVKIASNIFSSYAMSLVKKGKFHTLERNLIRANLEFVPVNYISVIFFTTLVSFFVGVLITFFFLFFNVSTGPPFISSVTEAMSSRIIKVFWIIFAVPAITYMFTYFYPSMERKSLENRLNNELPFATIHMSSISSSMIEPSKIFTIIMQTKEYPYLEKELTKLINEVNVYGYDLVTALRDCAFNSPSRKLSDLYNGLATTITSGGDLPEFFDKRSQTLLFEHGIETEKRSKAAETFMDVYISVVIAAPMILMLLLVMMSASGLGLSLSTGMITLIMVLGVALMNILFLSFLQMKQPGGE